MFFVFPLLFFSATLAQNNCPTGAVWDSTMNSCLIGLADQEYYKAELTCLGIGGNLATIANAFQNSAILQFVRSNFCCGVWIGLDMSGFWQDGTKESYTNFAPNEPAKDFRCTQMDQSQNGMWITRNCSERTDFICSIPKKNPAKCLSGWTFYEKTGYCYQVMKDSPNLNFDDASARCKQFNAQLASIHSRTENHFMTVLAASSLSRMDLEDQTWIGMRALKTATGYNKTWNDKTKLDYQNFANGEPNGNDDCILLVTDFNFFQRKQFSQWYDHPCTTKMNSFMCKMRPSN